MKEPCDCCPGTDTCGRYDCTYPYARPEWLRARLAAVVTSPRATSLLKLIAAWMILAVIVLGLLLVVVSGSIIILLYPLLVAMGVGVLTTGVISLVVWAIRVIRGRK